MSKSYSVLLQEIKAMQAHADAVKAKEIGGVIARIKEAIKAYSITMAELCADGRPGGATRPARSRRSRSQQVIRFRDANGNVWGGRGPRPRWLREALAGGKSLKDFEV